MCAFARKLYFLEDDVMLCIIFNIVIAVIFIRELKFTIRAFIERSLLILTFCVTFFWTIFLLFSFFFLFFYHIYIRGLMTYLAGYDWFFPNVSTPLINFILSYITETLFPM